MSCKFALLLLFGFVALAVAVPLEDTEQKAEPAEPAAADDEKLETPLEESEADNSEDENLEDTDEEPEADDNEEEPENEVEAEEEDDNDKRSRRILVKACSPNYRRPVKCRLGYLCISKGVGKYHHQVCYFCKKAKNRKTFLTTRVCQTCPRCRRYYRPRLSCKRTYCKEKRKSQPYTCKCYCQRRLRKV